MIIQTEDTPNPNTVKFYPDCTVVKNGHADFKSRDEAKYSPLALRLFDIDGVAGVFLAPDYISVTKVSDLSWSVLKTSVLTALIDFFLSGEAAVVERKLPVSGADDKDPIIRQIKEVLEKEIKPSVVAHGGNIEFHSFINGVVYVDMQGACAGCPASSLTIKGGVERKLRLHVPEVNEVMEVISVG